MRAHGGTLAATEISKSHGGDVVLDASRSSSRRGRESASSARTAPARRRSCECSPGSRNRTRAVTRRPGDLTVRYLAQQRERAGLSGGEAAARRCARSSTRRRRAAPRRADERPRLRRPAPARALRRPDARGDRRRLPRPRLPGAGRRPDRRVRGRDPARSRVRGLVGRLRARARGGAPAHEAAYERYSATCELRSAEPRTAGPGRRGVLSQARARDRQRRPPRHARARVEGACRRATLERSSASRSPGSRGACSCRSRPRRRRRRGPPRQRRGRAREFLGRPVSLELRHGDRLAIVGPNGSGKTTLLRALVGELPLAGGDAARGPVDSVRRARAGPLCSSGTSRCSRRSSSGQGCDQARAAARKVRALRRRGDAAGALALTRRAHAATLALLAARA